MPSNNVQTFREDLMMSKAELARKAGLSTLTIDRVEAGRPCRLDTKRKILLALGLKVSDKDRVFSADGIPNRRASMSSLPHGPHASHAPQQAVDAHADAAGNGMEANAGHPGLHDRWRGNR